MKRSVYFDNNATTALSKPVLDEMLDAGRTFGNASSFHRMGTAAAARIDTARERIAAFIGCIPEELIFTSGGTESNNLAVRGALKKTSARHIITSCIEHPSVYAQFRYLENNGYDITWLDVDRSGMVDPGVLKRSLRKDTALVSIMFANNEIGTVQSLPLLTKTVKEYCADIVFHTDAVQAPGKIDFDIYSTGVDMASFSSHKLYGPKGVGALYIKKGIEIEPVTYGGHHERGLRPGTENVQGIAGFGRAAFESEKTLKDDIARMSGSRDRLLEGIRDTVEDIEITGSADSSLPNTLNVCFKNVEGESVMMMLDMEGICVSTGSACSSGTTEPSHVLMACGIDPQTAQGAIRFSLGTSTTAEDVDYVIGKLGDVISRLREISPLAGS